MNEAALRDEGRLRDVERWKDKIEVRLDNRQVFFLFFGSAVVACMLFVLGVIVGKRIESRGRAEAADVQDPLAALDRAHQPPFVAGPVAPPTELLFPKALQAGPGKGASARADRNASVVPTPAVPAPRAPVAVAKPTTPVAVAKPTAPVAVAKPTAPVPPIGKALPPVGKATPPVIKSAKVVAPVGVSGTAKPAAPAADATKVKGKYTLQLSAFPTREEAEAFAAKYDATFIVPSEIPGKGTWFRVRAGNFSSYTEATAAKTAFEKTNKVIALVSTR
ncbi:MAG: Sporulation domain protein [Myxococcales bacterium]|nr:Sporulation domain protein [Myxococcales bacterium]